jgi:hypothetical protein
MRYLLEACETQLMLQASGQEIVLPPPEICEETAQKLEYFATKGNDGDEWRAYLRLADRLDRSYRN